MGLKVILFGLSVVVSNALAAQDVGWRQLSLKVAHLYQEGRYEEAIPIGEEALREAQADLGWDNPNVASLENNLAELYQSTGKYARAESLYRDALAINVLLYGPENAERAKYLGNLGELFSRRPFLLLTPRQAAHDAPADRRDTSEMQVVRIAIGCQEDARRRFRRNRHQLNICRAR